MINNITRYGGFLFYVGEAKRLDADNHNSKRTYKRALTEVIKRLDDEFKGQDAQFLIFMDDHEIRSDIVKEAIFEMHQNDKYQLLEAPIQVDSKLYQTIQCADWLCSIYGKLSFYEVEPESKPDYALFKQYFSDKVSRAQKRSNVRNNIQRKPTQARLDALVNKFK